MIDEATFFRISIVFTVWECVDEALRLIAEQVLDKLLPLFRRETLCDIQWVARLRIENLAQVLSRLGHWSLITCGVSRLYITFFDRRCYVPWRDYAAWDLLEDLKYFSLRVIVCSRLVSCISLGGFLSICLAFEGWYFMLAFALLHSCGFSDVFWLP